MLWPPFGARSLLQLSEDCKVMKTNRLLPQSSKPRIFYCSELVIFLSLDRLKCFIILASNRFQEQYERPFLFQAVQNRLRCINEQIQVIKLPSKLLLPSHYYTGEQILLSDNASCLAVQVRKYVAFLILKIN